MKLIKIIMAVVMSFGMMIAQGQGQGQGPDPFQQAFMTTMQNGGTPDEAFEAVAVVRHQMEVECNDCEMTEEEFQEGKAEAKAAFDAVLADGGTPQEAMHAAMEAGNDGPPTCDVCGYTFTGEGDHHGHCDHEGCDFVFTSDNDHHGHCDHEGCDFVGNTNEDWENHSHDDGGTGGPGGAPTNHWDGNCAAMCGGHGEYWLDSDGDGQPEDGPYATWDHDADGNPVDCGCGGDDGDHDGDEGDHDGDEGDHDGDEGDHDDQGGQCRYEGCDFVGSTDDDWRGHCDANPDHCRPQAGDTCGYGHDGDEACDYVFTGDEGEDHHHCDTCGVAMSSGQDMDQHCQDNPEHCRPRAGDTCECGFTFAGTDADENHRHCPTCNAQFDNDGDMGQHCQDNEGHCGDNNDQN